MLDKGFRKFIVRQTQTQTQTQIIGKELLGLDFEDLVVNDDVILGFVEDGDVGSGDDLVDLPDAVLVANLDEVLGEDEEVGSQDRKRDRSVRPDQGGVGFLVAGVKDNAVL